MVRSCGRSCLSWFHINVYFWLYFIPIGLPLMIVTSPIWAVGLIWGSKISRSYPRWAFTYEHVFERFYLGPTLLFGWLCGRCRRYILIPYRQYKDERWLKGLEPSPLPHKRPRRLSEGCLTPQRTQFLTKIPLEIRKMIYEHVIKGGTEHRHMLEIAPAGLKSHRRLCRRKERIWGAGCSAVEGGPCPFQTTTSYGLGVPCAVISCFMRHEAFDDNNNHNLNGSIALAKTCRQIYLETIGMYYRELSLLSANFRLVTEQS